MNMKDHILAALREQLDRWRDLLDSLCDEQIAAPQFDLGWSIKDVIVHLWAWQQISVARMVAGAYDREPELPPWLAGVDWDWEGDPDQTNNQIHDTFHEMLWPEVYRNWKEGYLKLIESGEVIPERELLDGDGYPWLNGYSLAFVLVALYNHHQEHLDKLNAWLRRNRDGKDIE